MERAYAFLKFGQLSKWLKLFFFVFLKQTVWRSRLEQNMKMIVFPFWFDSNYTIRFSVRELYAGRVFNDFMMAQILYGTYYTVSLLEQLFPGIQMEVSLQSAIMK